MASPFSWPVLVPSALRVPAPVNLGVWHHQTAASGSSSVISSFNLKFGRAPGLPGETIATTPVTVFVGPNNSGRRFLSMVLDAQHIDTRWAE